MSRLFHCSMEDLLVESGRGQRRAVLVSDHELAVEEDPEGNLRRSHLYGLYLVGLAAAWEREHRGTQP